MNTNHSSGSSGNKGLIALIIGGMIILGLAGVVLFQRSNSSTQSAPVTKKASSVFKAPAPLVVNEKPDVIAAVKDTETEPNPAPEPVAQSGNKKHGGNSGGPMGTIDTKELTRFINSKFASVRTCYEKRLKNDPTLQGTVDLRIGLSTAGKVTSIGVNSDSVRDAPMLDCVKKTVRRWTFPKPKGGRVVFDKPFQFKKKI